MDEKLIERLRSSAKALRENTVYTEDGDPVRLGVQAEEFDEAADRIQALEVCEAERADQTLEVIAALYKAWPDAEDIASDWPLGIIGSIEQIIAGRDRARGALRRLQEAAALAISIHGLPDGEVADFLAAIHREAAMGQLAGDGVTNEAAPAPACVNHPDRRAMINLDGDDLCRPCANDWARGEGQAAAEREERGGAF